MWESQRFGRRMLAAILMLGLSTAASAQAAKSKAKAAAAHFKVVAPDLETKSRITAAHVFNGMGCNGQNISPALNWQAQSFS